MKKIILITIVCLLIPCFGFAQETGGTLWEATIVVGNPGSRGLTYPIGFYRGHVYTSASGGGMRRVATSLYVNMLVAGFFTAISIEPVGFGTMCGITHLNGSGLLFATGILYQAPFVWFEISTLRRTSERWVPNETGSREE